MKKTLVLVTLLMFTLSSWGYAANDIVQISPHTYMISREDHGGIFGNAAKMKAKVIKDANKFAESQGKIAVCISSKEKPMGNYPGAWATFEYQFRVVDKNDPEAQRTSLVPRPDVVIDKTEKISADIHSKDMTEKQPDLYTELVKLDDLRKKGLLNDAEFEAQKQKLLDNQK
jgi:hypothetical protein